MAGVKVQIVVRFNDFPAAPGKMAKAVGDAFGKLAPELLSTMQAQTPVDTGELRGSETGTASAKELRLTAGTDHAQYVEFGTKKWQPSPTSDQRSRVRLGKLVPLLARQQALPLEGEEVGLALRHISPRSSLNDVVDRDAVYAESCGNLAVAERVAQRTDFPNLLGRQLRRTAAAHVRHWHDGFQMVWIHAQAISAQVVDFHAGRDFPLVLPVGPAVNVFNATVDAELGVPARARYSLPHPASVVVNDVCRRVVAPIVMAGTKANRLALDIAATGPRCFGEARRLTASALAQAGRIRPFVAILITHCSDLLRRSGSAVPGAFAALPGVPILPKTATSCGKSLVMAASAAFGG